MNVATNEIAAVGAHLNEVYPMLPFTPVRGAGVYLENAAGRRILDLYGGHAVAALGYGHRDLSETLARASRDLVFQTNALPLKIRDEAAEKLAAFGPAGLGRVFFVNSGAEANENALRLALKVTGRTKIVAMEHSFHGRTAAAARRHLRRSEVVVRLPAHAVRRRVRSRAMTPRRLRPPSTRARPPSSSSPCKAWPARSTSQPEFMHAVRAACDRAGALLIIDEVQTGMGRLGAPFGAQLYGVRPDLLTVAKGLGGGFPCGAVLMPHSIAADLKPGALGTTFGGGPVACAAIKTVIEVIQRDNLLANVRDVSAADSRDLLRRTRREHSRPRLSARLEDAPQSRGRARRLACARHLGRHERRSAYAAAATAADPVHRTRTTPSSGLGGTDRCAALTTWPTSRARKSKTSLHSRRASTRNRSPVPSKAKYCRCCS